MFCVVALAWIRATAHKFSLPLNRRLNNSNTCSMMARLDFLWIQNFIYSRPKARQLWAHSFRQVFPQLFQFSWRMSPLSCNYSQLHGLFNKVLKAKENSVFFGSFMMWIINWLEWFASYHIIGISFLTRVNASYITQVTG